MCVIRRGDKRWKSEEEEWGGKGEEEEMILRVVVRMEEMLI